MDRAMGSTGRDSGSRLSIGTGSTSFGRHSAVGVGVGTSFNLGGGPALAQTIEVLMGKGPPPRDPQTRTPLDASRAFHAIRICVRDRRNHTHQSSGPMSVTKAVMNCVNEYFSACGVGPPGNLGYIENRADRI